MPQHELDAAGQRLLRLLVSVLPKAKPDDPRTFITYKRVHSVLGLPMEGPSYGASLLKQGLDSLARWCVATGKPGITGLIVNEKHPMIPSGGYFDVYGRSNEDFDWWREQIDQSKKFDWNQFLEMEPRNNENIDGTDWSDDELRASVVAYLDMQKKVRDGIPFVKTEIYNALSDRFARTPKSFEFRMQNISYVLSLMGREWISGLKPAKNVGAKVAERIERLLAAEEKQSLPLITAFEIAVREGLRREERMPPGGNLSPSKSTIPVTQIIRSAAVKAWVLKQSNGVCECCNSPAPFYDSEGLPYLEVHHLRRLADGGSDTTRNAIATCPNCHRELHYGRHAAELKKALYERLARLRRE